MGIVKVLIFFWLLVVRFILINDNVLFDFMSVIMAMYIMDNKYRLLSMLTLYVNLSVFYTVIIRFIGVTYNTSLIGYVTALFTLLLTFNVSQYGRVIK